DWSGPSEIDTGSTGVDVEAVATQEADEGLTESLSGLDRQVGRGRDSAHDRDSGDGGLLDDLEADPTTNHQDPLVQGRQAGQDGPTHELVEGVVAAYVLAQDKQAAGGVEQAGRMEPAGSLEHGLAFTQASRQGQDHIT